MTSKLPRESFEGSGYVRFYKCSIDHAKMNAAWSIISPGAIIYFHIRREGGGEGGGYVADRGSRSEA